MSHEPRVSLHNVAAFVPHPEEKKNVFSRLPLEVRQAANPLCQERSLFTSGVEIRCNVGGAGGSIKLFVAGSQSVHAALYLGDFLAWPLVLPPGITAIPIPGFFNWPWLKGINTLGESVPLLEEIPQRLFDPRLVRILFPTKSIVGPVRSIGQLEAARPDQVPSRTLLCYGSSITQGTEGLTPTGGYAPRLARLLGMDLINLGFGGSAHLEPEIAHHIAQRKDWHVATLEMGINMRDAFTPDQFAERARFFVKTIAASGRPVFCLDLFRYFDDFPGGDPGRARAFRQAVAEAASASQPPVRHVDISQLPGPHGLCADLLHPSPEGMEEIARALHATLGPAMA
jgi:lysophospholipase L1-like esterase